MHGFTHIRMFDDNSTDYGLDELARWIDSGFVSVQRGWTHESLNANSSLLLDDHFNRTHGYKNLLESDCKKNAISWGYDIFVSLDIDEYLMPIKKGVTIVDGLEQWFLSTRRSMYRIPKLNFQSAPHLLEPVHMLTIEAYRSRMAGLQQLNYYDLVSPKVALYFKGANYTANTTTYLADCCHFHDCWEVDYRAGTFCFANEPTERPIVANTRYPAPFAFVIHHYSRSVEKFGVKGKTWALASREMKPNQTSYEASINYDLPKFFARSTGLRYDERAVRYSCQLREVLRNMTGESPYLRPGNIWYRNPEFGKVVTDPEKRRKVRKPRDLSPRLTSYHRLV